MPFDPRQQIQVLHVDDDPSFTDLTKTSLEREDDRLSVETAVSADEELTILHDRPQLPDCIVSDYEMPKIDGIEFLQAVREQYPELPFILLTGKGSEEVASDAISAGVTDYIQKQPGTERFELLANRIQNAVQARREKQRADRTDELMRLTELIGDTGGFEIHLEADEMLMTDGCRRLVGVPDDAHIPLKEAIEFFHPDDQVDVRQTVTRAAETGEQTRGTHRLQTSEGDERLVDVRIAPATQSGDVSLLRGAINDVTERRQRQQELEQIEALFQNAQDGLFLLNVEEGFTVERVNPAYERATGLSAEEVHGQTAREVFGEQKGAALETRYQTCVERQQAFSYTEQLFLESEPTWWEAKIAPVMFDDSVEYIAGSTRNMTTQREQSQEVTKYNTIVEALTDAVYVINEEGEFTYVNDEFVKLVGYEREEILGSGPSLIKDADSVERAEQQLARVLSSDGPDTVTFEVTIQPSHDDPIVCEDHMRALPYEGEEFEGSVGVLRDITEQKAHTQRLEAQNARLEEFTKIVSHELRSPLSVAEGYLELAVAHDARNRESEHLVKAHNAIERSQALIEDLLTLARAGEQLDELASIRLTDVAEGCWETVETAAATLTVDATHPNSQTQTQPPTIKIEADRSRLKQLFENLYRNAVEHGGDDVTVSVGICEDGFDVADTGSGIPESERDEIFEAGYSTNKEGTGFGLRIVKQVADAHGWDIHVTDSEQGGARFKFSGVRFVN